MFAALLPGWVRNSVRAQLVVLFFAITAGAVGFVYLYVVPQLSSSLTAERLQRLELVGAGDIDRLTRVAESGRDPADLARAARQISVEADARVTFLAVEDGVPAYVVADSESDSDAVLGDFRPARGAAESGTTRSGVIDRGNREIGETAVPIPGADGPEWITVYSTPLDDVADNVALIERQILIAGSIALAAALLAAWFAAGSHARRLGRLDAAAEEVAQGHFNVPIPIDSRDEVGELAATFDEMQTKLARLDSARREFIANASHELRTPVASLGGFLELLTDEDPDPETRDEFLRTMRGQVVRLEKLTADLLDLSKLDADAMGLSEGPVDLIAIASEVAEEFTALAAQTGHSILIGRAEGGKPLAQADYGRTQQIVRILIDNAVKHTREGTTITIETEITPRTATIAVTDDGAGIDAENLESVFDRFHTHDAGSGSGLGLAISRELARVMGGELELASEPGRTRFALHLRPADNEQE
ncbi:MAG TPA: HAMP domain-containing sensor histidine kinase [Solirubrobacterales bacterium]|nr:HAMP domain-containing sensor histidine kinase [Solirubrobacterales bacterium]